MRCEDFCSVEAEAVGRNTGDEYGLVLDGTAVKCSNVLGSRAEAKVGIGHGEVFEAL